VEHDELPLSFGFDAPALWNRLDPGERSDRGFCDGEICVMTDDAGDPAQFVRGVIEIPIVDAGELTFLIGVWSSLSQASYDALVALREGVDGAPQGPWFGWLSNRLPVYPDTLGLPADVTPREPDLRPLIRLQAGDHPLVRDQDGITFMRAVELSESWLHAVD
jgi:hypothetical protein